MQYRTLGKTGKDVSILGFGCMRFPVLNDQSDKINEDKATKLVHRAIELGVNYFDTAYPYHSAVPFQPGNSEIFLGKALSGGKRQKVRIATKMPSWMINSRDDMQRILEDQLKRLQVEHIDFYLVHALMKPFWAKLPDLGLFDFLDSAKKKGLIGHAGFSFHDEYPLFPEIVDAHHWDFCQIQYNYMDEEFQAGKKGLEYAAGKGLGVVIMEPLRGGALARNIPPAVQKIWDKAEKKRSPAEWAFRFLFDKPEISIALSGMNEMEQLEENVRIAREGEPGSLTSSEKELIGEVRRIYRDRMKVNCTACKYCMPCPHGVNIPGNFTFYNILSMFEDAGNTKFQYNVFIPSEAKAAACTMCGHCVPLCPQKISIPEKLKEVTAAFSG